MQTDHQDVMDQADPVDVAQIARLELEDARARLGNAAERVKDEARNAGSTISTLVMDELDRRASDLGGQLRTLAGRMRGEQGDEDIGPAPRIVDQAAGLIDDVSHRLEGQSARQIGQSLERFGRENPALFMLGCLAAGVVAGRMIVASSDETDPRFASSRDEASGAYGYQADWAEDAPDGYDEEDPAEETYEAVPTTADWSVEDSIASPADDPDGIAQTRTGSDDLYPGGPKETDRNV